MHSVVAFNRLVLQSAPPSNKVAFLVPTSFRQIRPLKPPVICVSSNNRSRRFILASSASAKTVKTTSTTKKSKSKTEPASVSSNASSTLVIVESPAKASTIQSILPSSEYVVRSCIGHIREIPSSAKRIPAKYKEYDWSNIGVNVDSDFKPIYVLISGKQALINDLRDQLRQSSRLILATDDDREGEAISWHLLEVLKPTVPVHRAVFHEITPSAINSAFENFRPLNMALVDAQETRRVLDRLIGYTMSPLLWKKIARGLSAGRVQSVAMSEIVKRERERLLFKTANYSSCNASLITKNSKSFQATLSSINGIRLVKGSDFDDDTGKLKKSINPETVQIYDEEQMQVLCDAMNRSGSAIVSSVERRQTTRNPPPPLITSTLQQECGNRLGMGAGKTMSVAQKLYETGIITYMRTDNPTLSDEAINTCRATIEKVYGKDALAENDSTSGSKRKKKGAAKPKAAQAAHEAIRPAGEKFIHPNDIKGLSDNERAVYRIIYSRALGSQMASAKLDQTTVKLSLKLDTSEKEVELKATGSVITSPGFLLLHQETAEATDVSDDEKPEGSSSSSSSFLPLLEKDDVVDLRSTSVLNHQTKPPPRFNDASLVKILEERGVGRPSTYAGIIEKLITRGYAYRGRDLPTEKKVSARSLVPSLMAFAVDSLLSEHFPSFVDAEFTARMEKVLDEIATGSADRTRYLDEYYSGADGLAESVKRKEADIFSRKFRQILLPNMPTDMLENSIEEGDKAYVAKSARTKSKKGDTKAKQKERSELTILRKDDGQVDWGLTKVFVNSYGPYIEQDGNIIASLPKKTIADDLSPTSLENLMQFSNAVIGTDPETKLDVVLKTSNYGPYIQLGRNSDFEEGEKPKRCGLSAIDVGELTLDLALKLLSLPRLLGIHEKSGEEIRAGIGPYGPYIVYGTSYVSLKKEEHNVLEIGFDEAVELIDAAEARKQKRLEAQKLKAEKEQDSKKTSSKNVDKTPTVAVEGDSEQNTNVGRRRRTSRTQKAGETSKPKVRRSRTRTKSKV